MKSWNMLLRSVLPHMHILYYVYHLFGQLNTNCKLLQRCLFNTIIEHTKILRAETEVSEKRRKSDVQQQYKVGFFFETAVTTEYETTEAIHRHEKVNLGLLLFRSVK